MSGPGLSRDHRVHDDHIVRGGPHIQLDLVDASTDGTRKRFKAKVMTLRKQFPRIVVKYIEDEAGVGRIRYTCQTRASHTSR